jgi:hypothetical protein
MKHAGRIRLAAVLAVLATVAPGSSAARPDEAQPLPLTIAFTGDVIGYLEPCG